MAGKAILYTSERCLACQKEKRFLEIYNIPFEEKSIGDPQNAQEMVKVSGQFIVPVLVIGGKVISGFSPLAIKKALIQ